MSLVGGKTDLGDIARYGGFGLAGMAAAKALRKKKKKKKDGEPGGGMTAGAEPTMRKGGKVKKMAKGGKVRGCGIAKRGLTKGKMR
jgi:hypothetical protein